MDWPPKIEEPLPRAAEAVGVREKLIGYSLDLTNEVCGAKARGFELILGITMADVDYLERALRVGILTMPVGEIRDNAPYRINCMVAIAVRGLREKSKLVIDVRTVWEITAPGNPPTLVSAFPRPRLEEVMATVKNSIREHDVIELLDPVGGWPAGRIGAVVSDYGEIKLVEIADQNGVALDFIQVPDARLKLVSKHSK